jgi:hypothetical protein
MRDPEDSCARSRRRIAPMMQDRDERDEQMNFEVVRCAR